jgi:FMN phosphatase YigB (HAD superfamily)
VPPPGTSDAGFPDELERTFGTRNNETLHTAQSIFHDVVPARRIGLATLWINRRRTVGGRGATPAPEASGSETKPDLELGSMADLVVLHQAHLRGESA